jgi:hypothetical protein
MVTFIENAGRHARSAEDRTFSIEQSGCPPSPGAQQANLLDSMLGHGMG